MGRVGRAFIYALTTKGGRRLRYEAVRIGEGADHSDDGDDGERPALKVVTVWCARCRVAFRVGRVEAVGVRHVCGEEMTIVD